MAIAIKDSVAFVPKKVQADPQGRYLILVGEFNNRTYTIVNVYAPNTHQLRFMKRLSSKIETIRKGGLIMCGDYNITADYKVDTTTRSKRPLPTLQPLLHTEDDDDDASTPRSTTTPSTSPDTIHTRALI